MNIRISHDNLTSHDTLVRKKWLYSFVAYYGYLLMLFCIPALFGFITLYDILLWIFPCVLYFFAYKRFDVYSLLWLTGMIPLIFFRLRMIIGIASAGSLIEIWLCVIQGLLLIYFLYNSYLLLKVNEKHDQAFYDRAVVHIWIVSLLFYCGFSSLLTICSLESTGIDTVADGIGTALVDLIRIVLFYYFAIKRRGTFALGVMMFFIPNSWAQSGALSFGSKVIFAGFLSFFCINTYRLYQVNKRALLSKIKDHEEESVGIQQNT